MLSESAPDVLDLTVGDPDLPAPDCVRAAIDALVRGDSVTLHSYTTAAGLPSLRQRIADDRNTRFGTDVDPNRIYVTCGGAAGLAIALRAVLEPGDQVLVCAPVSTEYRLLAEAAGASVTVIPPAEDLRPDPETLEAALGDRTRAVILGVPNTLSGVLPGEETLLALTGALRRHEEKLGRPVYLLSDEPYRELLYDGAEASCVLRSYDDTILCCSFSKTLAIPGERLGFLAVGSHMTDGGEVYASIAGAGRAMGYVNPPSLIQRTVERCLGSAADVSAYRENRDALLAGLRDAGYTCAIPAAGFALFFRSPEPDAQIFCARAEQSGLLLSPGDGYACPGWVRAAFGVPRDALERAIAILSELI